MQKTSDDSKECNNCHSILTGDFCHQCGQPAKSRRGPLVIIFREMLDEFNLDSKFLHSLLTLMLKPGKLTQEFIGGKRFSMLPPFRMYLVISLIFIVFFEIPAKDVTQSNFYIGNHLIGKTEADPSLKPVRFALPEKSLTGKLLKPIFEERGEYFAKLEPQILVNRLVNNINDYMSTVLILAIPLLAIVLKLLFYRSDDLYFDHLIFSLHFQSFLFLMTLIIRLMIQLHPYFILLTFLIPVYLFVAMRVVFRQKVLVTLFKQALVMTGYAGIMYLTSSIALFFVIQSF